MLRRERRVAVDEGVHGDELRIGHLAELPQLGHPARLVFNRIRSHGGKPILAVDDRLGNAHVRLRPHEVDYLPNRPPLPKLDEFLEGLGPSRLVLMTASSEEHTSELQSLLRNSSSVFCLNK